MHLIQALQDVEHVWVGRHCTPTFNFSIEFLLRRSIGLKLVFPVHEKDLCEFLLNGLDVRGHILRYCSEVFLNCGQLAFVLNLNCHLRLDIGDFVNQEGDAV